MRDLGAVINICGFFLGLVLGGFGGDGWCFISLCKSFEGFSQIINVRWESFWEGFTFTGGIGIMGKLKN